MDENDELKLLHTEVGALVAALREKGFDVDIPLDDLKADDLREIRRRLRDLLRTTGGK